MNIHHHNMRQVSEMMADWVRRHMAHLQIYDCTYSYCNFVEGTRLPITTAYDWYCQYNEQSLDLLLPQRILTGSQYWNPSSVLFKNYSQYVEGRFFKIDLFSKTHDGFEMFTLGCNKRLLPQEYQYLKYLFQTMSKEAMRLKSLKPNLVVELRTAKALKAIHQDMRLESVIAY
jgi:phage regulator Rha-like protein